MKTLLIETSGPVGLVGLALNNQLIAECRLDENRKHCQDLAPTVRALLAEQGWKPAEVQAVFVSLGPGSYTGLRVGVMAAKAFAYAVSCKLIGVPTLNVLAAAALGKYPRVEVIEDAQQGRVYTQRFEPDARGLPCHLGPIAVFEHEAWLAQLDPAFTLTGPGLGKKHDCLTSHQSLTPTEFWTPTLAALTRLGAAKAHEGTCDDPLSLEPIYARMSSAEEKWTALGR